MRCVCALRHTDIRRHGRCCAEVGYHTQTKIPNLKANIFVDYCSSCSSNCKLLPHACVMHRHTIAAIQETDRSITGLLRYGNTTQYTVVRLHHCIPRGSTMVRPRAITMWSYHGNTTVLVYHGVPWYWYSMLHHGMVYHGIAWYTMVYHGIPCMVYHGMRWLSGTVPAGCVRLCRVASNIVWSHMASDTL